MAPALLRCRGHPNIQASHPSTLELEEESFLTIRGDCIVCIECTGADELRRLATGKGLAKLFIVAMNPFLSPYIAYAIVDGFLPAKQPKRLIARKSAHRENSVIICSSLSASELPSDLRKLLRSNYTKCYALLVSSTLSDNIDAVYELVGCVVKDTSSTSRAGDKA